MIIRSARRLYSSFKRNLYGQCVVVLNCCDYSVKKLHPYSIHQFSRGKCLMQNVATDWQAQEGIAERRVLWKTFSKIWRLKIKKGSPAPYSP